MTDDDLDRLLMTRAVPAPPANFTASVMAHIRQDAWRMEQVVDMGFNLALGVGTFLIVGGVIGLLWSAGLLGMPFDLAALSNAAAGALSQQFFPLVRNVIVAAVVLSAALGLWWWAESTSA